MTVAALEPRIAGSDTREAFGTPTVKAAAHVAMLAAGPGWAAAFTAAAAWDAVLGVSGGGVWLTMSLLVLGAAAALLSWRLGRARVHDLRRPPTALGMTPMLALAGFGIVIAVAGDAELAALALPIVPLVSGLAVADAAMMAARACVPGVRPAAGGLVAGFAFAGLVPGVHLMLVGAGSGLPRASGWTAAYLLLAAIALRRAHRVLPMDRHRIAIRERDRVAPSADDARHALALRGITVRFGPNLVLDEASLAVSPGELVALVGGNGAGKSTLLRAASGFVPIETGQVTVAGEDVTTLRPDERAASGLSFVSGARPVFPELTVLQNLRVAAFRTHKTSASFEQATEALLGLLPTLADRRDEHAGVLSGGEQRLLAVAQSLYRRPAVLLADELTLGLDVDARLAVMDLLLVLALEGVAVVAVDHDLPSLLPRAHRAALLSGGGISMHEDSGTLLRERTDLLPATFLAGVEG